MSMASDLRPLLGATVDVETADHLTVHGTLLSCTSQSLWLVDGDDDLLVLVDEVREVRRARRR
jgi:hypothetical protein